MKIMSFNVNGIRARLHQLETVIAKHQPDVIGLQETKVEDSLFPLAFIEEQGYNVVFHGQKGHYGVALLYRGTLLNSSKGFPDDGDEAQCRLVSITLATAENPVTIYNGYFPQGESRSHPTKFANKAEFYQNLTRLLQQHQPSENLIVLGDMNVAPLDKDIGIGEDNRKRWLRTGKCCFLPEERQWLQELSAWGLVDSYEQQHPQDGAQRYSWFDYRSGGFSANPRRGLRIDLILATPAVINRQRACEIDQDIRAMEKPSDHCPVWLEAEL
ncbi:MAG: exodeoxyribonuclease III [Porticoccaceae bacterium]|nr:exodeoxyribonuclease III [Porticoccaceae bacterium]